MSDAMFATAARDKIREAGRAVEGPGMRLIRRIAAIHGLTAADIIGYRRLPHITTARFQVCHELRRSGKTLPEIGRLVNKDHSSVHYAIRHWPERAAKLGVPVDLEAGR